MACARLSPALLLAILAMAGAASALPLNSTAILGRKLLQRSSSVHPRYSIAEVDEMEDDDPYKLVMIAAWTELVESAERGDILSYWRLAGIHGKKWAYNDVEPPPEGFCLHRSAGFGPWHRAYMKMFENALIQAAQTAVASIEDSGVRRSAAKVASTIRLPYWDWTRRSLPGLLTQRSVSCYQSDGSVGSCRNPFSPYTYKAAAGSQRSTGSRVRRASNWQGAMRSSSGTFARQMASFVRSNNWRCTYTGASTCFGNLEQVHNDIHNILGGTGGDMATIEYAGFDPLFWLHHCMLDRALWLFQNNGVQWNGQRSYSPFQTLGGDVSQISSLGYTYTTGGSSAQSVDKSTSTEGATDASEPAADADDSSSSSGSRRRRRRARFSPRAELDAAVEGATAGTVVGSPAAKAAVRMALEQWTGNYTGYQWAVRFQELNEHQLDKVAHVYVFLNTPSAHLEALPARVEEYNDLRIRPGYCGSASGFNDYNLHAMHASGQTIAQNRAVDLTDCLQAAGISPNVAPASTADPARGPSAAPVRLSDLKIVAVNSDGEDVTSKFDFGKPVISWSLPVSRTVGQIRAVVASDPEETQALASPTAFGADEQVYSVITGDMP